MLRVVTQLVTVAAKTRRAELCALWTGVGHNSALKLATAL